MPQVVITNFPQSGCHSFVNHDVHITQGTSNMPHMSISDIWNYMKSNSDKITNSYVYIHFTSPAAAFSHLKFNFNIHNGGNGEERQDRGNKERLFQGSIDTNGNIHTHYNFIGPRGKNKNWPCYVNTIQVVFDYNN